MNFYTPLSCSKFGFQNFMSKIPPVALIIFNRPDYTERVFAVLKKVRPSELFIIADAGRTPEEQKICESTRSILDQIDWPCTVHKNYADTNMGVRSRIESGISWVFEHVDRAVILEDDCVPEESFFHFCSEMLERYKDDERIMMISGDNPISDVPMEDSYTYSRYFAIWGWATWRRAWAQYDSAMTDWPNKKNRNELFALLKHRGIAAHLSELFDKAYTHKINSWATRWFYTCLWRGAFSIVPKVNLVSNIGVEGVHSSPGMNNNVPTLTIDMSAISHPKTIEWNRAFDLAFFKKSFPWKPIEPRVVILRSLVKAKRLWMKIIFKLTGVISLKPKGKIRGTVLLSYISSPFLRMPDTLPISHTNEWECYEIAKIFLEQNFAVDVIEWNNQTFTPKKPYDVFIDIHQNIERLAPTLGSNCLKIFHITGAHWEYMNNAEQKRLADLLARRNIALPPKRNVPPSKNIEYADIGTSLGNKFTWDTYKFSGKTIYPIPISTPILFDMPKRDMSSAKKKFIWFGGTGFVHKGLDIVLEAFVRMPEYSLTVIGPIKKEKDFEAAFATELYKTPNINTIGWLSIDSPEFTQIIKDHIGVVYPSCSEGGGGSVITCMHAGLIPIVTAESSVNTEKFGVEISNATVQDIIKSVTQVAHMSDKELSERTKFAWEYARRHHTKNAFASAFRSFVSNIVIPRINNKHLNK